MPNETDSEARADERAVGDEPGAQRARRRISTSGSSVDPLCTKISAAVAKTNMRRVQLALNLSSETVARLAAGLPVQRGTLALARANEHELDRLLAEGGKAA